jgi:Baseplate J-like protein
MSQTSDCGCCSGVAVDTPAPKFNRPGLKSIAYRVGTYQDFKPTVLARLSGTDFPALAGLSTRHDSDYSIAICDAFAVMADVLTFYQERVANEAYLRTATERRSVLDLSRLIGYQLAPGLAAQTALAFTLQEAPGQASQAAQPVTVPIGTRVQSVPDPGQTPQTFETTAVITARVEWNAIPVQRSEPVRDWAGRVELHLAGTGTQLQPGDAVLFVGAEDDPQSGRWEVRRVGQVEADAVRNLTRIGWPEPLSVNWSGNPNFGVRVYALRQRASLFGSTAPQPQLIFNSNNPDSNGLTDGTPTGTPGANWKNFTIPSGTAQIDLDAVYPKIAAGGWVMLTDGTQQHLYRVVTASQLARADYAMSAKVTRIKTDRSDDLTTFDLRITTVLVQSEELIPAGRPLPTPLMGGTVALDRADAALAPAQLIAVSGKRQRVAIGVDTSSVSFPGLPSRNTVPGELFVLTAPPELLGAGTPQVIPPEDLDPMNAKPLSGTLRWHVQDSAGNTLRIEAAAGAMVLRPALADDLAVSEVCTIATGDLAVTADTDRTRLVLQSALTNCYDRSTAVLNANVAPASHGESVGELAGNGDAAQPNQRFRIKQPPLTYVASSNTPEGRAATLQVRVNDLLWNGVPTLYDRGPRDRVYTLRQDDSGNTTILFGDGDQGARLPSGQNNVRLSYRRGIGAGANLRAGQLTNLLTRPLGVQGVTNPDRASGGQDPETLADARKSAPIRVLTLGRAVSAQDYADFARTFAGIAKAEAVWIAYGRARGIHLTVAGPQGAEIAAKGIDDLSKALRRFGDALLPLTVQSRAAATFVIKANMRIAADADGDKVLPAIEAALRDSYSFDRRGFGQPVTIDEAYAVIAAVPGVVSADIPSLYRSDSGALAPQPAARLLAKQPAVNPDGSVTPAELLTLDPGPIEFGVVP